MGEGYVHRGSLLAHVVPRRHERVALAEARLRDFGEVRSCVEDGPEAAGRVVPRLRSAVTWPLDRRRDAAARSAAGEQRQAKKQVFALACLARILHAESICPI